MQNRYAADIGDYIKLSLLRRIGANMKLGIAWYLFPDEGHNSDGKHVAYLNDPQRWKNLDPSLFDSLNAVILRGRSVGALEREGVLEAEFFGKVLDHGSCEASLRSELRYEWFAQNLKALAQCDMVFADPDNGLIDDKAERRRQRNFGKQMPLSEARALAEGRTAIIYHHNTRFPGGHDKEVDFWLDQLGHGTLAIRANAYSCRTFFIVNPTNTVTERVQEFCRDWSAHKVRLHRRQQA